MARRSRKWQPIGKWLRNARKSAGLSVSTLSSRTGVSISSLTRFESDRAIPSFGDVCAIAQELGWPLLYFATGLERTGDDTRALAAQLHLSPCKRLVILLIIPESCWLLQLETAEARMLYIQQITAALLPFRQHLQMIPLLHFQIMETK